MLTDTTQIILGGEISSTTPAWNLDGTAARDDCIKCYLPLAGRARIVLDRQAYELAAGDIFLFNATRLQSQRYQDRFDHFWIHFVPADLTLKYTLFKYFHLCRWPAGTLSFCDELLDGMRRLTEQKAALVRNPPAHTVIRGAVHLADDSFQLKLQAALGYLVGDLLERQGIELTAREQNALAPLLPAVAFMDRHYRDNPPLATVARAAHMAPSGFHRSFVRHFGLSPHRYMQRKRLTEARQLLLHTRQSVKQIARACGYHNEFYFSRVFKNEFRISPTRFRHSAFTG